MRERLTSSSLATLDRALRFGDLVVLPSGLSIPEQTKVGEELVPFPWVKRLLGSGSISPWIATEELRGRYENHREATHRDPWWLRRTPEGFRRHVRFSHYLGDGFDPLAIMAEVPYTGVGYAVAEDGLIADAAQTFGVFRLSHIRQLAFLHDPLSEGIAMRFEHTRYCHVLDVMALATLMAARNNLAPVLRRTLRVAAFTHDVLTPAGGDTTKVIDREAFDEDLHYAEIFGRDGAKAFLRRHRLTASALTNVVHGKGVLGKILDLADKMAYVGRDAQSYVRHIHLVRRDSTRTTGAYQKVDRTLRRYPHLCGFWDSVVVDGDRVIVTDALRLGAFLDLRARLFRDLYYSPGARFLEHTVASVIIRDLYETGALTREKLLAMTDDELDTALAEGTGFRYLNGMMLIGQDHAFVETFRSRAEAERREDELERTGEYMVLVEEFVGATGTGAKIQTVRDGRVGSFAELYPERTERIMDTMKNREPYRLYYFPIERGFTPWFRGAMDRYRARRAAARDVPPRV